jgi:hypothetical protein
MKSSKELLRDIDLEIANQRNKSPIWDFKSNYQAEPLRSEVLADRLLEKVKADKERFAAECRKIKNQILQILDEDNKKSF